ncbi:hypothetical protein M1397_03825 [Candidatus Marsarchaeota archaeon]|jgi:hypothetical protein|nr:hypothetical protein [Candidatus Marsarchaeota archaeon]
MKAQLSFEMLIYLGLSLASIAAAVYAYVYGRGAVSGAAATYSLEEFVAAVNSNAGFQSSSFYAYVPNGLCNASLLGNMLIYRNATYYFESNVSIAKGLLCAYGFTTISTERLANGTILVT